MRVVLVIEAFGSAPASKEPTSNSTHDVSIERVIEPIRKQLPADAKSRCDHTAAGETSTVPVLERAKPRRKLQGLRVPNATPNRPSAPMDMPGAIPKRALAPLSRLHNGGSLAASFANELPLV